MNIIQGGVCAPKGFKATGIHAGLRNNPTKKDLSLIFSQVPCVAAGATTQNLACAAPVLVTRTHLAKGTAQAIICNSGNANACAPNGEEAAYAMCTGVGETLGIDPREVLVASTGVIGQALNVTPIIEALPQLVESLSTTGSGDCASAIMTTDLKKKEIALNYTQGDKIVTLGGIAKGSGMIHPNMATMLGFVTTDVAITSELLEKAVLAATADTFNMVSVDGDTSTNDMILVLANGLGKNTLISVEGEAYNAFYAALLQVFKHLAVAVAADGEGGTKLLTSRVTGGKTKEAARGLAKGVITSNLVKAAMFGEDANWGRILCAMGYSGLEFSVDKTDISLASVEEEVQVCKGGQGLAFDEAKASRILATDKIDVIVTLGDGKASAVAWGCDLTYDYVKINGGYRS